MPLDKNIPICRASENVDVDSQDEEVILRGHFSVFESPYEIDSYREGNFMETIAPGAFRDSLRKVEPKVLLDHGHSDLGDRPLGKPKVVREDSKGGYYEVSLFHEASYVKDLIPALRSGVYGSSFRFTVDEEEWNHEPKRSTHNPDGIPERTITKANVIEFGPTLWGANPSATAGIRSATDEYYDELRSRDPASYAKMNLDPPEGSERTEKIEEAGTVETGVSDVESGAVTTSERDDKPSDDSSTEDKPKETTRKSNNMTEKAMSVAERRARLDEIKERWTELDTEFESAELPAERQTEWDSLEEEYAEHERAIQASEARRAKLETLAKGGNAPVERVRQSANVIIQPDNIYDVAELRRNSASDDEFRGRLFDSARRAADAADYSSSDESKERNQEQVHKLLSDKDDAKGSLARKVLATGSPEYKRAFGKWLLHKSERVLSASEQRAMALGSDPDGGYGVPFELDPTIILTSDGAINPLRQVARVERITGKHMQLVTSAGVTVTRDGEADPVEDGSPTLEQPEFNAGRVSGYLPFSLELEAGYDGIRSQLTSALAEAKFEEEALTFATATGNGLTGVEGLAALDAASLVEVDTAGALTYADILGLDNVLAPRHRRNATWLANNVTYNDVRLIDENVGGDVWTHRAGGRPATLNGRDANEMSNMPSQADADDVAFLIYGDFRKYVIIDRIGMVMDVVQHVMGLNGAGNQVPTGQRAIVAYWWNGGGFIDHNAFRGLTNTITP